MALPKVTVNQVDGNLGKKKASQTGNTAMILSGVAVGGQFALNECLEFRSLQEAEAKGITAAYDATNTCMVHKHVSDFYAETGKGTLLGLMVVAKTVTLADMVDDTNVNTAKKLLQFGEGKYRRLGIARIPQTGYVPTYATQLDADTIAAITNAKVLRDSEYAAHKPVRIWIEGRDFQGNASSALDLRATGGPNASRISVIIGQDNDALTVYTWGTKYAAVGSVLGREARIRVSQSIGRVKTGAAAGIVKAGMSNGALLNTFSDANLEILNDKGYVFLRSHTGKAGYFWNRDHACVPLTSDYAYSHDGAVMDEVARAAYDVYVEEILEDVNVDPATGLLDSTTCKHYEGLIVAAVNAQLTGDVEGVTAFVDPDQNVIDTDEVQIEVDIVRKEVPGSLTVSLAFSRTI